MQTTFPLSLSTRIQLTECECEPFITGKLIKITLIEQQQRETQSHVGRQTHRLRFIPRYSKYTAFQTETFQLSIYE